MVVIWAVRLLALAVLSVSLVWSQEGPSTVPLIQALREGKLEEAHRLLRAGAKLNVIDNYGDTPLFQAIRSQYTDFAEELISAGAEASFSPGGGHTALMLAAWYCNLRITRVLLDQKVEVNAANAKGETALMNASQTCRDGKVVQLLLDAGAEPNVRTEAGSTPLIWAAAVGNATAAEELLKASADATIKDKYGRTAEHEACESGEKGHYRTCQLIREALKGSGKDPG